MKQKYIWKGKVKPLTKKFLSTFNESEIEHLQRRLDGDICGLCIMHFAPSGRFSQGCECKESNNLCYEILGIYSNSSVCGCHVLGKDQAIAHIERIIRRWYKMKKEEVK